MGQYRLWLHYRAIDQNLRGKQAIHKQELSEIDEHIARIEKTATPANNALITMLMQSISIQEHTADKLTDTIGTETGYTETPQENFSREQYPTLPSSNYGQQGSAPQTTNPRLTLQPLPVPSWDHLPNFSTQDIYLAEEQPADPSPLPVAATGQLLAKDLSTFLEQPSPTNEQMPWWLRNLIASSPKEQELQPIPLIDEQDIYTNQRVGFWFARRARLVHYDE